jgi:hypothetical protein
MNILLAFLGWLAWNWGLFVYEKDSLDALDQKFNVKHYAERYWDNWVLSLICVPILIIIGIKGLGLKALPVADVEDLQWNDMYYLASGLLAEAVKYYIALVIKKFTGK